MKKRFCMVGHQIGVIVVSQSGCFGHTLDTHCCFRSSHVELCRCRFSHQRNTNCLSRGNQSQPLETDFHGILWGEGRGGREGRAVC